MGDQKSHEFQVRAQHQSALQSPAVIYWLLEEVRAVDLTFCSFLCQFIGNPSIQRCGLKLLTSVAECTGALEILTQQGATDTVLHTLQMYPDEQGMEGILSAECE